jgi:formylglycine-generating enzyme required for sulfatase activity
MSFYFCLKTLFLLMLLMLCPAHAADKTFTNSIGMEFVLIPAGEFWMGSAESRGEKIERPRHRVIITQPFYLGKYEVTQQEWERMMSHENNPSTYLGKELPVQLTWNDVQEFIRKLNDDARKEGEYRLPTEAEWEYACRAGTETDYSFGDDVEKLGDYGWFMGNSKGRISPVGQKKPNPWGLYDMHGNVREWVQDWYGKYEDSVLRDPQGTQGPNQGTALVLFRVLRGGNYGIAAGGLRSAFRTARLPNHHYGIEGFRLVFSPSHP